MMDNRQFNVNGKGKDMLLRALELACIQEGQEDNPARIQSWKVTPEDGLILYWMITEGNPLPGVAGVTAEEFLPILWAWLSDPKERNKIKVDEWDANPQHDGRNGEGWRVYCGDWGHVGGSSFAICAVKPVWLWYGK